MAKITKSVRLSEASIDKLKKLKVLLKESEPDLLERAIDRLYNDRQAVYEQDVLDRRKKIESDS